jgi:hypothetical protein
MISFRLSEDEYINLKNLCVNEGARSVSDLARDAVNRLITKTHNGHGHPVETVVQALQIRIEAMDVEIKKLSVALQSRLEANGVGER